MEVPPAVDHGTATLSTSHLCRSLAGSGCRWWELLAAPPRSPQVPRSPPQRQATAIVLLLGSSLKCSVAVPASCSHSRRSPSRRPNAIQFTGASEAIQVAGQLTRHPASVEGEGDLPGCSLAQAASWSTSCTAWSHGRNARIEFEVDRGCSTRYLFPSQKVTPFPHPVQ